MTLHATSHHPPAAPVPEARRRSSRPSAPRAPRPMLRRRRLAALVVAAVVGLAAVPMVAGESAGADPWVGSPVEREVVVVAARGDTLWTLALPHAPADADPHAFVAEVAERNEVDPARLDEGQVLRIPQG